jgi:NADP-dependent 3-hydroxy acid dehydrogenase YdfG
VTREVWTAHYADLAGKVAVLAGTSSIVAPLAHAFCDNAALIALVVDDRAVVDQATSYADQTGVASLGIVADPAQRSTWDRVAPHIEQRLGPIDIMVAIGPPAVRTVIAAALMPDMAARKRGVIVEAGSKVGPLSVPAGLRHRAVSAGEGVSPWDLAAAVTLCASDVLVAPKVTIDLAR